MILCDGVPYNFVHLYIIWHAMTWQDLYIYIYHPSKSHRESKQDHLGITFQVSRTTSLLPSPKGPWGTTYWTSSFHHEVEHNVNLYFSLFTVCEVNTPTTSSPLESTFVSRATDSPSPSRKLILEKVKLVLILSHVTFFSSPFTRESQPGTSRRLSL